MSNMLLKIAESMHEKRFEPRPRNKDGVHYVGHRFPIKGGISLRDVMVRQFCAPNPFFAAIEMEKRK